MHTQAKAQLLTGFQHAAGLFLVEGTALTEDVDPLHIGGNAFEHGANDLIEILLRVRSRRDQVRAQEGHVIDVAGGYLGGLHLGLGVKAVAGLGLEGGGATAAAGGYAVRHQLVQAVGTGLAGGVHGHRDAACFIGTAGDAGLEFGGAVTIEDHVGVRIYPAGQDGTAAQVHLFVGRRRLGGWADPGDGAGLGDNCGVVKRAALADRTEF